MTAPIPQQVSHDYLTRAADLHERGQVKSAELLARAAAAECDDPQTVVGDFCVCEACRRYLKRSQRVVG